MEPSGSPRTGASPESTPIGAGSLNAVDSTGSLIATGTIEGNPDALINSEEGRMRAHLAREESVTLRRRVLKFTALTLVLAACGGLIGWQLTHHSTTPTTKSDASVRYKNVSIPLASLDANSPALSVTNGQTLSINGQLNVNNSLVLAPTTRPDGAVTGQIYYDQTSNQLSYYNGSSFKTLLAGGDVASTTLGGASGAIATGGGLAVSGQTLSNTGVLTLQGQTGNITLAAGPGIVVNGTTLSNSGLLSLGGLSGDIAVGTGLSAAGGVLNNSGIISATGAGSITVTNDGNGNITIDGPNGSGGGGGTVASPGGTLNKIAKFTGVQTIADSLLSDDGTAVTVGGALSVTGTVSLSTPLAVTSGGTGANTAGGARTSLGAAKSGANSDITSLTGLTTALTVAQGGTGVGTLATNGVIIGGGTSALSSVVAGSSGLCLVSNAGSAPTWSACPGSGGVSSVDGGTGALTLNNSSLTGSTITISDATTAAKGIASFNSTNFSVSAGAVNTIQNINTTAAPTFGQLVLTSSQATNPMLVINNTNVSASGNLIDLQLNGSSRFSVNASGNVSSAGTINGQTISNAASLTGSLAVGSTLAVSSGATVGGALGVTGALSVNTITPTSSLVVGAAGQSFTLQGNASSTFTSTSGASTTSIGFQTPTANVTYNFPTAGAGTYNVCTTAGNCVGVGGGVTSTGGTSGKIAKFTGSGTIADSILSESGTVVTVAGSLSVNTLTPSGAMTIGATGQNLTLQGATVSLTATASGITNNLTFATPSGSSKTVTVPNASGTVAVSASGPLSLDANGNLTCPTCLSTGGSGGTTGVSSVNALSGALTLQGTNASSLTNSGTTITINDASSTVKGLASFNSTNLSVSSGAVNTVQDIAVTSTPTFGGLTLTAALSVGNGGTGATTAANARSNLGAAAKGANGDITSLTGLTTALSIAQGGTGITTTPANGQVLIGNGSGYSLNTLSAGSGVTITNAAGTITIAAGGAGTCAGCANASLNNLSSVAINTSLLPGSAGAADLGSGTLPFGQLFLAGTSASPGANNFKITGAATGSRVITLPDASGTVAVSASGNIALSATGNISFTGTLGVASGGTGAATLGSNGVLIGNGTGAITSVVAGSGGLCLTSSAGAAPTWATCPGSGSTGVTSLNGLTGALSIANATASGATVTLNDASTSTKGIASFSGTNFSATSGAINTIQDINTTAAPTFGQLTLTSSQATNPMLVINNTNASASGNLIDLQLNGISKLSVNPAGNLTTSGTLTATGDISTTSGNFSGGTLNGQTISSAASFTGTVAVASDTTVHGKLYVDQIVPIGSTLTIGAAGQSFTLQGNTSSKLTSTGGTGTTTVAFQNPTASVTYNFATAATGTYDICTTAGNCVGTGGGVTSTGGTSGKIAKFTGSGTIADSILSESGTTITVGGTLSVNTLTPSGALTVGATGQNLTLQGATVSLTATASGITNTLTFAAPSGSGKTITLPNASGTVAVSASGPLALDASGNLTCPTCLSTGGSGGTAGVSSLNSLTGGLTLQGSSAGSVTSSATTITINDATSSTKGLASFNSTNLSVSSGAVNTVQDIAVTSTPTFGGLTLTTALTVANGGTGASTAANARTNLSAAKSGANSDITSLTGLTTALSVAQGGSGITTTPTNGQILIGNGSGYSLNTLSAGSGVTITNSAGGITISAASAGTCAGCANTSLSNLGSVAINTSLLPGSAGGADLGSATLPFGQLFLSGTSASPASNNFKLTGAATAARTITLPDASGTVAVSASGNIALSASGNISFTGTLGVGNGGTGATTLGANGVLIGNGTSAVTSLVAGSGGLCLVSVNAAAPNWASCPGSGGVTSVDTQTGAITISNTSGSAGTITIDNASTSAKGIASFSSTNFTATSGAINTIQNINSTATPTFSSLSLTAASSLALGSSNSATGSLVFKGAGGTGTLTLQGPGTPNTGNFTLSLPAITANDTVCTVGQANCGVNTIGTIDTQTPSANGAVIASGSLYLQSASTSNPGLVNTTTQTFTGDKTFKSTSNSVTAFQVQNSSSASVFDVDTTNKRIGIGTNTPGRTVDIAINTTSVTTLPVRISQAGTGDTGIEFASPGENFYQGIDATDGQFKISSTTAANGVFTIGNQSINSEDGDPNKMDTYRVQTGATGGTLSSLAVSIDSVAASPNNHMELLIYSDNGSGTAPLTLLGHTATFVPNPTSWNTVSLSGVTVSPSTYYWIGFGEDGGTLVNETVASGSVRFGASYTVGSPPTTWVDTTPTPSGTGMYAEYMNITPTGLSDEFGGTPLFTLSDSGQLKLQNAVDSTTAFQIQNASGTTLMDADTSNSTIKIAGNTTTFATLQIDNAHFESTQTTAPTAAFASCGTGSVTVATGSTDAAGSFSFSAGSIAKCVVTLTFNKAYTSAPKSVLITPKSSNFNAVQAYVSATGTGDFVVTFAANAATSPAYQFYYWVVE